VHPKQLPGTRARPPMGQGHHLRHPLRVPDRCVRAGLGGVGRGSPAVVATPAEGRGLLWHRDGRAAVQHPVLRGRGHRRLAALAGSRCCSVVAVRQPPCTRRLPDGLLPSVRRFRAANGGGWDGSPLVPCHERPTAHARRTGPGAGRSRTRPLTACWSGACWLGRPLPAAALACGLGCQAGGDDRLGEVAWRSKPGQPIAFGTAAAPAARRQGAAAWRRAGRGWR
jgi:hypothetical protein